jgi:alpha-L-fucosidase
MSHVQDFARVVVPNAGTGNKHADILGYGSAQDVLGKLKTANARNSNLLLNVPPNKQGKLDDAAVKVLAEVGKLLNPDATGK